MSVFSDPIQAMKTHLAALPTFQAWCGVTTAEAAALHIHFFQMREKPLSDTPEARRALRPFVIIDYGNRLDCQRGGNNVATTKNSGSVTVLFEALPAVGEDELDEFFQFGEDVGGITAQLFANNLGSPTEMTQRQRPTRREESIKDGLTFFDTILEFGWANV